MRIHRIMMLCLVTLAVLAESLLLAQAPANKFLIEVRGGALTGSEEYQIERIETGYRLTGKSVLNQMGRVSELKQELTLRSDWGFEHYMLQASMMGRTQMIEASLDGQQVRLPIPPFAGRVTFVLFPSDIRTSVKAVILGGRCMPFVFGLMRSPARRSMGWASSAIEG